MARQHRQGRSWQQPSTRHRCHHLRAILTSKQDEQGKQAGAYLLHLLVCQAQRQVVVLALQ